MRREACPERSRRVPAAVPLIAYAAGLACGHSYAEAIGFALIALLLLGVRRPSTSLRAGVSAAFAVAALAGGVFAAVHQRAVRETNLAALDALPRDRFVRIEAPIDADWRQRGDSYALRCQRSTVNSQPITIYARFEHVL